MKKSLWLLMTVLLPMAIEAQNTWDVPQPKVEAQQQQQQQQKVEKPNPDQKYLEGAVPVADGRVVFSRTFEAPGKSAFDIYNIVGRFMQDVTQDEHQIHSQIVQADTTVFELGASYEEWLVFHSNAISLDRTRFYYVLKAKCQNGAVEVEMSRIKYLYEENRNPQRMAAEDWITDKNALNKKKTRLTPLTGKFRRKTIDRKDYLFNELAKRLK